MVISMDTLAIQIFMFFIIAAVGFFCRRINLMTEQAHAGASTILINIAMPAQILMGARTRLTPDTMQTAIWVFVITAGTYGIYIGIAHLAARVFHLKDVKRIIFISCIYCKNVGFLGYPLCNALFGSEGLFYAAIAGIGFTLVTWTYGVILFAGKGSANAKTLIKTPATVVTIFLLILFFTGLPLPEMCYDVFDSVGAIAAPLSMLVIGASLARVSLKKIFSDKSIYLISLFTLVVAPLAVILLMKLLHAPQLAASVCMMLTVLPPAATVTVLSEQYKGDGSYASCATIQAMFLSLATMPLMLMLADWFLFQI